MTTSADASVYYRDRYWNDLDAVVAHLNRRATGVEHPGWMHHLLAHHGGQPYERALILNCGNGWVERELLAHGVIREAVGVEYLATLADEAAAAAVAASLPITYHCADINDHEPVGGFDLVVNHAAAHHIACIDRVFRRIAAVLPEDGTFVSWDYVGPHRNQYPAATWEAAWALRRELPEDLQGPFAYGHVPSMILGDPTEAIHSELILPTLERYFHLDHHAALGGALGYLLLTHNAALLDAEPERRDPLVARILAADEAYVERHPDSTLFAYVLARPRKEVLADHAALEAWRRAEDEREERARSEGGRYYPPTLVHELLYPEPGTPASVEAPSADLGRAARSPRRAALRARVAAVPGARRLWRVVRGAPGRSPVVAAWRWVRRFAPRRRGPGTGAARGEGRPGR